MEPLFENKHIMDKDFSRELTLYQYFLHPAAWAINLFCIVAMLLCLLLEPGHILRRFMILYVPLFFLLRAWRYFRGVRMMEKRYAEVGGGQPVESGIKVYEDHLVLIASTGAQNRLSFDQIKGSFSTKHYYFLKSKSNMAYSLHKDGFVKGDLPGLVSFLKGKGVKIR